MRMGPLFINQGRDDDDTATATKSQGRRRNKPGSGDGISSNAATDAATAAPPLFHLQGQPSPKKNTTMTMLSSNSTSSADSGHPSGNFEEIIAPPKNCQSSLPPPLRHSTTISAGGGGGSSLITKYLVLLQDCVAIKFVGSSSSDHATNGNANTLRRRSRSSYVFNESPFSDEDADLSLLSSRGDPGSTNIILPDHGSVQGVQLYKSFKEANLKCYWNATLCDAIRSLEYKGWLLPSTILVGGGGPDGLHPQRLSVIRTAWGRKMLRNPPGYRIEFIGEVEEIIAEPVSQGQFAPLSDSLCWAILELTSSGQEAFVDSILLALANAFPLMSLPPRELVYTTLERLIRDRKIYQTSHGYFIVSPDTFRYMSAGGDGQSQPQQQIIGYNSNVPPLDALTASYYDVDKISQHSYSSGGGNESRDDLLLENEHRVLPLKRHNSLRVIRQRDLDILTPTMGARSLSFRLSKTRSLLVPETNIRPYFDPLNDTTKLPVTASPTNHPHSETDKKDDAKSKKQSFFRRLFSFRRSTQKKSANNPTKSNPGKNTPTKKQPPSETPSLPPPTQQQTVSLEQLQRSPKIYAQLPPRKQLPPSSRPVTDSKNRSYEDILEDEIMLATSSSYFRRPQVPMSKWNSLPSSSSGRRSRRSILNDSPFYDVLQFNNNNGHHSQQQQQQPCPQQFALRNNNTGGHQSTPSRTSSSLLGYGSSQRERPLSMYSSPSHHHHHAAPPPTGQSFDNFAKEQHIMLRRSSLPRIDSPSPSVSAIYASISGGGQILNKNNTKIMPPRSRSTPRIASSTTTTTLPPPIPRPVTIRSHPHNKYPPWRPRSAYELLAYQNLQNSTKKFNPSSSSRKLIGNNSEAAETKIKIASSADSSSQHHGNSGAEMSTTSSSTTTTIKSRTELQLQFPMSRMVLNNKTGGGRRGYKIGTKNDPGTTTPRRIVTTTVQFDTNQDGTATTVSGKNGGGGDCTIGEEETVTNYNNSNDTTTTTTMHDKHHHLSSSPSPNTSSTDEGVDIAN